MFDKFREISGRIWRSAAGIVCAALCGAFAALGMLGFDSPADIFSDAHSAFGFAVAVLFALAAAYGISAERAAELLRHGC